MALDDLTPNDDDEEEEKGYDIQRIEFERGFRIVLSFDTEEEENTMRLKGWLSAYVDDGIPRTRQELINDKVNEAVDSMMEKIREDYPDAELDDARIEEVTEVRKVKP